MTGRKKSTTAAQVAQANFRWTRRSYRLVHRNDPVPAGTAPACPRVPAPTGHAKTTRFPTLRLQSPKEQVVNNPRHGSKRTESMRRLDKTPLIF